LKKRKRKDQPRGGIEQSTINCACLNSKLEVGGCFYCFSNTSTVPRTGI